MNRNSFSLYSGFTLIEVLVVLSLIGILSMPILTYVYNARKEARDEVRAGTIEQLKLALKLIKEGNSNGSYPTCTNGVELGVGSVSCPINGSSFDTAIKNIYPQFKADPLNATGATDPANGYWYDSNFRCINNNNPAQIVLMVRMESAGNGNYTSVCPYTPQPATPNGTYNWAKGRMYIQIIQ